MHTPLCLEDYFPLLQSEPLNQVKIVAEWIKECMLAHLDKQSAYDLATGKIPRVALHSYALAAESTDRSHMLAADRDGDIRF